MACLLPSISVSNLSLAHFSIACTNSLTPAFKLLKSHSTSDKANELTFQNEMIDQLVENGWLLGKSEGYNRELALYEEDVLGFVQETQPKEWEKF